MPKTMKNSLAGGELSTDLDGRNDLAKYASGVQLMENFYPTRFGGASNRPGTQYIGASPWSGEASRKLIPFQFSVQQAYALEFVSRDITWVDSFETSVIDPNIWFVITTGWTAGGNEVKGDTSVQAAASLDSFGSTLPAIFNSDFEISGYMDMDAMPAGSAGDTYQNQQRITLTGLCSIAFINSSLFSAPNYRGWTVSRDGEATLFIDSDDFTNIKWSISRSGTSCNVSLNGVDYPFTSSATITNLKLDSLKTGTTADHVGTFSGIQQGLGGGDVNAQADNVMRVVKDGAIVLTSRRDTTYSWTVSGGGTSEYYCGIGGGDPSIPGAVELWENGALMTEGTLGSLAAGEWAWGDNDTLGYSTIYVRLTDSVDPDTKDSGYVQSDYQLDTGIFNYNLNNMTYAQSKDTLFIASAGLAPAKITRTADDAWAYSDLVFAPSAGAPLDFYSLKTGMTTTARQVLYQVGAIDSELNESLPSSTVTVDMDLNWPTAGRIDLYWNNITDGLEATPVFTWNQVGATNEYYCTLVGGGDPSLLDPFVVWEDKIEMTRGTVTSLAEGQYWYGDNDTLGFDTIYCRIVGGTDPDLKAVGYITFKLSTEDQWSVYKNYRGDWGWLGAVQTPWFLDDNVEPDVAITPKILRDPFNTGDTDDYPGAVAIYEQRLVYARSNNDPQRVWTSVTGDLTNFATSKPLSAEDPITVTLVSGGRLDEIKHLLPLDKLLVFTTGSEWTLTEGQNSDSLTPFSVQFKNQGYEGISGNLAPIGIANKALFIQRNDQQIRSTSFNLQEGGYPSQELTLLAAHLFENRTIVSWCYQQHPTNIVWMVMSDGELVSMTYLPEQEVIAFARHSTDGLFKDCTAITSEGEDEVYFAVDRIIGGSTVSMIEQLSSRAFTDVRDAKFLDSALSYDPKLTITNVVVTATEVTVTSVAHGYSNGDFGLIDNVVGIESTGANASYSTFNDKYYKVANVTGNTYELEDLDGVALTATDFSGTYIRGGNCYKCTNSVSGLDHLEGEVVRVLADGNALEGPFTVTSGAVTLGTTDPGYGVVHIGLGYSCNVQTLRFDLAAGQSTVQTARKCIKKAHLRLKQSSGGYLGRDADNLTLIKWRQNEEWQQPNALKTGDVEHVMKSYWDDDGRIYFRQSDPLPTTILAIIMEFELGD